MIRFRGYFGNKRAAASGLDIDFTTGTLDPRITFARGSTATYYNASGLVASAASGAPRFDYDPVTLAARGLLLEEQRTNLILNSQDYAGANWVNGGGITLGAFVTAPDGTLTARTFSVGPTSNSSFHSYFPSGMSAGATYSLSVWAKKSASGSANKFRMTTNNAFAWGTGISQSFVLTSVWQRFVLTGVVTSGTSANIGICDVRAAADGSVAPDIVDLVGDIDLWGAQLELSDFITSYIPTTTAAVTRAADTASMTGTNFSSWYNATEGTFFLSLDFAGLISDFHFLNVFQAASASANRMVLYGDRPHFADYITESGSGATKNTTLAAPAVTGPSQFALAFKTNDAASSYNGAAAVTDTSVTVPTVDSLNLGRSEVGAALATGWFKRLTFYNTRKSNSELQALTAPPPVGTGTLTAQAAAVVSTTGVVRSLNTANALAAQAAAATSTSGISRSLITDTTLGADAAVVVSTTGISRSLITDTTLDASPAAVASTTGVSSSTITDTTLAADPAVVASTSGISRSLITDTTLVADPAVAVSTAGVSRSLITDTTIDAGVAAVASTTGLVRSINTANTLAAQAAAAASTTGLSRSIAPSSALAPQRSTVSGVGGTGTALFGTGVLNVLPAAVAGTGLSAVTGAGALQAVAANSNGSGLSQFIGTGALFAEWAAIAGLGSIPYSPFVSGPYTQVGDLWEGAAVWGKIDGKWRRMRLWSRSAAAWGMVAWDKDAQEVDVISEPAYGVLAVRSANVNGAGFIRDQFWGTGDLRAGPALVTDSSSLSGLSVITNAAWEPTPAWVKVNGKWRRATMWTNVSEEWKRVA